MCAERGQTLVEMALVIPMLLLLLLGIIEIGRYAELSILVANAARAGVQYGAQNLATAGDFNGIELAAKNDGDNVPGLTVQMPVIQCGCSGQASPGATCPAACGAPGSALVYVQVKTNGNFNALFGFPGIPATIVVNGSAGNESGPMNRGTQPEGVAREISSRIKNIAKRRARAKPRRIRLGDYSRAADDLRHHRLRPGPSTHYHFVAHAAREGSRYASVRGADCHLTKLRGVRYSGLCKKPFSNGIGLDQSAMANPQVAWSQGNTADPACRFQTTIPVASCRYR